MTSAAGMGMSKSYLTLGARMMLFSLAIRLPWPSQLPPYSNLSSAAVGRVSPAFIRQFATLNCYFPRKLEWSILFTLLSEVNLREGIVH